MLTIGYVGNGKSANRYHLPFVLERKNIRVKTIFDIDVENVKWEKLEGVKYTSNINELMDDPEIEVIVICTVQKFHFEYAKMALEHGKNVLCEKPFMNSLAETNEIFRIASEKNLVVQCFQNRRFDSDFLTVQKVIEEGKLGDITELEMHFDYFRPEVPTAKTEYSMGDSFLYTHACHTLDQVISYFGMPDDVVYDVRQLMGKGRMNDYFDLDLFYGNMKVSVKSSYFRIKERPSFVVYGKNGMFVKAKKDKQEYHLKLFYMPKNTDFGQDGFEDFGTLTYLEGGVIHEEKYPSVKGDYGRVYDNLYATIKNGKEQFVKPEQTIKVMEILEHGGKLCHI